MTEKTMTAQEVVNVVVAGLRGQGWQRSKRPDLHVCQYRGVDGRKCAVGHLIPDDVYNPDWDRKGSGARCIVEDCWALAHLAPHVGLLEQLQGAHDGADGAGMEERVRLVVAEFGLEFPEVDQ